MVVVICPFKAVRVMGSRIAVSMQIYDLQERKSAYQNSYSCKMAANSREMAAMAFAQSSFIFKRKARASILAIRSTSKTQNIHLLVNWSFQPTVPERLNRLQSTQLRTLLRLR